MDTLNIRWDTGVAFWVAIFLPKQLSLVGMQKSLYFEKIGIAFRLQIVHFRLQTCVSITKVAFRFTNATFRITIEQSFKLILTKLSILDIMIGGFHGM